MSLQNTGPGFARAPGYQASLEVTKRQTLQPAKGSFKTHSVCRARIGNSTVVINPSAVMMSVVQDQEDRKLEEDSKQADSQWENRVVPAAGASAATDSKVAKVVLSSALVKPPIHGGTASVFSTALVNGLAPATPQTKGAKVPSKVPAMQRLESDQKSQAADSKSGEPVRSAATATAVGPIMQRQVEKKLHNEFSIKYSLGCINYEKAVALLNIAHFENFLITQNGFGYSFILYKANDKIKCRDCRKGSEEDLANKLLTCPQGVTMASALTLMPELFLFPALGDQAKSLLIKAIAKERDIGLYLICKDATDKQILHLYYMQLNGAVGTVRCTIDTIMAELAARKLTRALIPEEVTL
jgi:hypothetical protein